MTQTQSSQNLNTDSAVVNHTMSKKYMSRPPYCFGEIPDYTIPPMTVEEYQYYEREFFGFLDDKPVDKQVEAEPGFVQRFLQLIGISKVAKYEDEVSEIKFNVHHVMGNNEPSNSRLSGTADCLNGGASANVVRTANKATQTEEVVKTDQGVQTEKCKRGFLKSCRRFIRRSFKCLKTAEE
ncbi:hypothetical protein LOTGIDRAFT_166659 [Lottia gigantea]|uniref:Uncharacterized protein n=1 Tax=Lottia gigantea TaxID=225164 RepID=V4A0Y0_LOTGI|nr:hypothetical protein LOTGIDRAFT_166659 [Lottia gigantea]ESO86931.1 hypothetical protein LOTGIDRAFT_166659 [Lottia gigantea]